MASDLPGYVWVLALTGAIGIPASTCAVLYLGAVRAGLGRRGATAVAGGAAVLLGAAGVVSAALAGSGEYLQRAGEFRPWLGAEFVVLVTLLLVASRIPAVARSLDAPGGTARLTLPHTLRVLGVVFVVVMALGKLPAVFALPAGLGDIAVGLAAPSVARRLARGGGRGRAVWFNVLGIVDLVVAVGIAFFAGLGPFRPLAVWPSTEPLGVLPLALIPTVAVPVVLTLHVVALGRLHAEGHTDPRAATASDAHFATQPR